MKGGADVRGNWVPKLDLTDSLGADREGIKRGGQVGPSAFISRSRLAPCLSIGGRRGRGVITAEKKKKKSIRFGRGMRILFIRMINSGTRVVYAGACGGNPQ